MVSGLFFKTFIPIFASKVLEYIEKDQTSNLIEILK